MSQRKDKEKVIGEHFDDERIKSFLDFPPPEGVNRDYHVLVKAYRGMGEENFNTFVQFFLEAGYDINVTGPDVKTFLQSIKVQKHEVSYLQAHENTGTCLYTM